MLAGYFVEGLWTAQKDWTRAKRLSEESMLQLIQNRGAQTRLGCTFLPEKIDDWNSSANSLQILQYCVETLHIKDIRFGLRWNKVEKNGNIDLAYYASLLEYMHKHKVKITLNIGPVKTALWPETYVPQSVATLNDLPKRSKITPDDLVGKAALLYLARLLKELKKQVYWKSITMIQPENESYNYFGDTEWIVSDEYLSKVIQVIRRHYSGKILLNSSGTFDLSQIKNFLHAYPQKNLTVGLDYYYTADSLYKILWTRGFDHVTNRKHPFGYGLKDFLQKYHLGLEVTEAQYEPWNRATHPGSSLQELNWLLLRCLRFFQPSQDALIRLWGIEQLIARQLQNTPFPDDQKQIDLIQKINKARKN